MEPRGISKVSAQIGSRRREVGMTLNAQPRPEAELDQLVQDFYSVAFHSPWQHFRERTLQSLTEWSGAAAAAWLTRNTSDLPGEYAVWPVDADIAQADLAAIGFTENATVQQLRTIPKHWLAHSGLKVASAIVLRIEHRNAPLYSTICLVFARAKRLSQEMIERAADHLVQAGTLSLSQFVQRDEWLQAMGRPSRGSAALIDLRGGLYVASERFRELLRDQFDQPGRAALPFTLPAEVARDGRGAFDIGALHFRVLPEGNLYLIHARRPHPLDALSPREQEVALALAQGKSFKSAASEHRIAVSTVANHASRIYLKLGLRGREDLVRLLRTVNQRPKATE
jgi:DNA-binding CsgD family transcriptional regulator